jgi:hypothetical protein
MDSVSSWAPYVEEALVHFEKYQDSDTVGDTGRIGYLRRAVEELYDLGAILVEASAEEGILVVHLPKTASAALVVAIANIRADEVSELDAECDDQSAVKLWWD